MRDPEDGIAKHRKRRSNPDMSPPETLTEEEQKRLNSSETILTRLHAQSARDVKANHFARIYFTHMRLVFEPRDPTGKAHQVRTQVDIYKKVLATYRILASQTFFENMLVFEEETWFVLFTYSPLGRIGELKFILLLSDK